MKNNNNPAPQNSQIILYQDKNGEVKLDVRFDGDTVWLTQKMMAELFNTTKQNISLHLKNIYKTGELAEASVVKEFLTTATDGKQYRVKYYDLDVIIAVGYRVNSTRATQFRIWATQKLKDYIVKGFVLDNDRLKNPDLPFDYFEELSRQYQDIRTSEKRFYRKITDIYALSVDYDPTTNESIEFFKTVQNKVHWAITGNTAAELIVGRADSNKPNMGLTSLRGVVPRKDDVIVAKNYLDMTELEALNNLIEQYLVFAEGQARRRVPMKMADWITKLHGFLQLNDRDILQNAGKISHELAKEFAEQEYDKFNTLRINQENIDSSDFDQSINKLLGGKGKNKKVK